MSDVDTYIHACMNKHICIHTQRLEKFASKDGFLSDVDYITHTYTYIHTYLHTNICAYTHRG